VLQVTNNKLTGNSISRIQDFLVMACHTPPFKKAKKQGNAITHPSQHEMQNLGMG